MLEGAILINYCISKVLCFLITAYSEAQYAEAKERRIIELQLLFRGSGRETMVKKKKYVN
jgi:hypothetical protein